MLSKRFVFTLLLSLNVQIRNANGASCQCVCRSSQNLRNMELRGTDSFFGPDEDYNAFHDPSCQQMKPKIFWNIKARLEYDTSPYIEALVEDLDIYDADEYWIKYVRDSYHKTVKQLAGTPTDGEPEKKFINEFSANLATVLKSDRLRISIKLIKSAPFITKLCTAIGYVESDPQY